MKIPRYSDIQSAYQRICPHVHRTPVLCSKKVNEHAGGSLFFKCENFQKAGAFKFRGATHAVGRLSGKDNSKGVATHSSGNHGQAISLAAKGNGLPAHIVMPDNAPRVKVSAVRDYEANIIFCKPTQSERERVLASVVENTGAKFIHPYDDPDVIAGQGTAALELLEDYPDLDFMLTPVGGGGLLSGTAIAASGMAPNVNIIGSEPEAVNDAYLSFRSGNLHPAQKRDTVADGLKTSLSELTFACIQQHVDEIMTVTEQEIVEAMRFIWERMKIIIEPSSAVPVAVAFNHLDMRNKRAGIIISGGNLDLDTLPWQN